MRRLSIITPLVLGLTLLAGCAQSPPAPGPTTPPPPTANGVEALTADEIVQASTDALTAAGSYRVVGEKETLLGPEAFDVRYVDGDMQGTTVIAGFTVQLLVVDGFTYVKGDDDYLRAVYGRMSEVFLPLASGKWVLQPDGGRMFSLLGPEKLVRPDEGELSKGELGPVQGQQAITLESADGGTVCVALVGEPYPIRISKDGHDLVVSEVGAEVTIAAPDPADVFTLLAP